MIRPPDLPRSFAAAIFDFDETMIDLEEQHEHASASLCRQLGGDYDRMPESFRLGSGRRVIDDVRDLRAFFGWLQEVEALMAIRQRHFIEACRAAELTLLPGVERAVRGLREKGLVLAIASSSVRSSIEELLARFGLRDCFAVIIDGSEVVHGKPDPEAYRVTAERLGVEPARCLVFEDSQVGVLAAKAAGAHCIAVRNPFAATFQDLDAADVVLTSFEELELDWLD